MFVQYPDLENKIILVTGATRGIGRSIALNLAKQKSHVVFNYRGDKSVADNLEQEIIQLGGKSTALKFDVTDQQLVKENLGNFLKEVGPIAGLVNNAGISKDQIVLRIKEEDVLDILNVNLKSSIMIASTLSRHFLKAEFPSVVNISSVVGLMGNPSQIAYSASKAGMLGFTKSYAKELASKNIRCNALCPGFINTDMTESLDDRVKEHYYSQIPLKRFGETDEVAGLTCFLLSRASSYITGEIIKIDGGLYI